MGNANYNQSITRSSIPISEQESQESQENISVNKNQKIKISLRKTEEQLILTIQLIDSEWRFSRSLILIDY